MKIIYKNVKVSIACLDIELQTISLREIIMPLQYFLILSYIYWVIAPQKILPPADDVMLGMEVRYARNSCTRFFMNFEELWLSEYSSESGHIAEAWLFLSIESIEALYWDMRYLL